MKKLLLLIAGILSLFTIVSCKSETEISEEGIKDNFNQERFEENLALWKQKNIQNYEVVYETMPDAVLPQYNIKAKLTKKDGKSQVEFINYETILNENDEGYFSSIDDMFDYIIEKREYYLNHESVGKFSVYSQNYDSIYNFPTEIYFKVFTTEDLSLMAPDGPIGELGIKVGVKILSFKALEE